MQQQHETETAVPRGYTPAEYSEVVRRAQAIRADRDGRLTERALAESAAEVGIREEDLQEAARQLAEEKRLRAQRQSRMRTIGAVVAAVLALFLMFSYNSLNSARLGAVQSRANLQSVLQRRADVLPNVARVTREGAATERELVDRIARAREGLRSSDLATQLKANAEISQILALAESNPQFRSSELYQSLIDEIAGSENRINVARQRYNEAATRYNERAQSFPTNLARPLFGMPGELPYFQPAGDVSRPPAL